MFELIYRSIAHTDITPADISDILNTARTFNEKNNITGCLIFHDGEFIQLLEGNKKLVKDLYANIEKDKRHAHVTLLAEEKKKERMFQHWSMAFNEFTNTDVTNINRALAIDNFTSLAKLTTKPSYAVELFLYTAKQLLEY